MQIVQELWSPSEASTSFGALGAAMASDLVLVFAAPSVLRAPALWERLRARFPGATIAAGSSAGEICGTRVTDDAAVVTALRFANTRVRGARIALSDVLGSREAGAALAAALVEPDLAHVFVLSDGLHVNGSELVRGLSDGLPTTVPITGGLCGDGPRFVQTHACLDGFVEGTQVVAVGLYGRGLEIGQASFGGWDPFGPERRITRAKGNQLYELDGGAALDLYEKYLGEHAAGLPASGLLFPLAIRPTREDEPVVRTILAIDRESRSLTFAGDVPVGYFARLMRANLDRLIDGASRAASVSASVRDSEPDLAILVSCVGRKLVLGQRVEEEVEAVQRVLGARAVLCGFYSYGEISPFTPSARCELHNQTMTITTVRER